MASSMLAEPKIPPKDVLAPGIQLLGYGKWVAAAAAITSLMWGGAFLWATDHGYMISEQPGKQRLRILTAMFSGVVVSTATALAMWVFE